MKQLESHINLEENKTETKTSVKKILGLINQTIQNPSDNFASRINYIIDKAIHGIEKIGNIENPIHQKKLFDEVCGFLNGLFKECQIKKLYNYSPSISLSEYKDKDIGEALINNIYGKEWKLFYRDEIKGGSCYHRTVILKKLFDKLKASGLKIESKVILYDTEHGHSMVLVKFQNETYIADVHGFNENTKKIISSTKELDDIYQTKEFGKFSFNQKQDGKKLYFENVLDFSEHIDQKTENNSIIEFKPRLENNEEKEIKIIFEKEGITLTINGKRNKYNMNKFRHTENYKNGYEIINHILKNTTGTKEGKQELGKYLNMVSNKMNRLKIMQIYA